jgi:hypothetical protein
MTSPSKTVAVQVAGAAATLTLGDTVPARSTSEATGKLKIEKVGLMAERKAGGSHSDQSEGLNVYTGWSTAANVPRGSRAGRIIDVGTVARLVAEWSVVLDHGSGAASVSHAKRRCAAAAAAGTIVAAG